MGDTRIFGYAGMQENQRQQEANANSEAGANPTSSNGEQGAASDREGIVGDIENVNIAESEVLAALATAVGASEVFNGIVATIQFETVLALASIWDTHSLALHGKIGEEMLGILTAHHMAIHGAGEFGLPGIRPTHKTAIEEIIREKDAVLKLLTPIRALERQLRALLAPPVDSFKDDPAQHAGAQE